MSYVVLFLSVVFGFLLVLLFKPNRKFIRLLLAFSGAYLLSVTVIHLLPEVYNNSSNNLSTGILILFGILLQFVLESFSKGAEHGHIHLDESINNLPKLLFISLCIHAFTEGMPVHDGHHNLLWAIMIHKLPIAIVLSSFFLKSKLKKSSIFLYLFVFSLMTPLGVFAGNYVTFLVDITHKIDAFVIGVFLHISTVILFESTENHKFNLQKFLAILLGIILTIIT